ncbi:MAG: DUF1273 domain-containing protein [Oscillospiraceae bacterium]|jgi:uncharacterized phage-like protein YoqJ|nr:DUF1273 domain-containing protein [Oscillospiraceae bacterium]
MQRVRAARAVTCCFSGYRPEKLPWGYDEDDERCRVLKGKLYDLAEAVYVSGIRHFIVGMACGSDMYFCEQLLRLREEKPDVTIEAAIPCEGQATNWAEGLRNRYFALVSRCNLETLVSKQYTYDCMKKRNRYMVDRSSMIIVVYDGKFGGTMYTRRYAAQQGLEIIDIMP